MPRRIRENTLASFVLALDEGADGIELDVHATRDGMVVVHHDACLRDGSEISLLSREELALHEAAPGLPIPTLAEVCDVVQDRAALFVEIKGAGIETLVSRTLAHHPGDVSIHSFDHALIARLHAMRCPIRLGVLLDARMDDVAPLMARTGARDVWPHHSLVTDSLVEEVHAEGGRVIAWTVNDRGLGRALARAGVDGLCGDDVTTLPVA